MTSQAQHAVSFDKGKQGKTVCFDYRIGENNYNIYFSSLSDHLLSCNNESALASALLPCMKAGGGQLIYEGEVSEKFISALTKIQDIYCRWDPSLSRVKVEQPIPTKANINKPSRVGLFFSGGVDSFYTFLKNQDEITDLIFIHGTDIKLSDIVLREKASKNIKNIAVAFGKELIEIETNIKELLDPYIEWGALGHGAALASIGHLLAPYFRRIYIASSFTYADLFPWGSHPILDPLWSTEALEFIHDGCESTRVKKVALIAKSDVALKHLRVCYKNPNSSYNCGVCEKCIRTMINLKVNDALTNCDTFDHELTLKNVMKIIAKDNIARAFIKENLEALERSQGDAELHNALTKVLNRPLWPYKLKKRIKKSRKYLKKRFFRSDNL